MTDKQKMFIKAYVISKNASKAAREAGYSANSAGVEGARLLKKASIKQAIDAEFKKIVEKFEFTEEDIKSGIYKVIESKDCRSADRLRGWELLGKAIGLFRDNTLSVTLFSGLDAGKIDKARELLKARGLQRPADKARLADAVDLVPDGNNNAADNVSDAVPTLSASGSDGEQPPGPVS